MPFDRPVQVIAKVLARLGIDPRERLADGCQDPEYTSCRAEEIPSYFQLYARRDLTSEERDVLCCFLLEGLNELIQLGTPHPLQTAIFDALFDAEEAHRVELAYWMNTSEPDSDNWWPITAALVAHKRVRS
ncbi:MAG: hypothetical protein KF894_26935 [Labilithrix sp.]|nr:hypothetical protein [Labilithrix sp.]